MTLSTTERQVSLFDRNRIANPFARYVTLCKSAPVELLLKHLIDKQYELKAETLETHFCKDCSRTFDDDGNVISKPKDEPKDTIGYEDH